jgi:hypothetical protein
MQRGEQRALVGQGIVVALVIAAVVIGVVRAESSAMSREDLKIAVGDVRSFAAEGSLLAEHALSGHTTQRFHRGELSMLHEKIDDAVKSLDEARPRREVQEDLGVARQIAHEVRDELNRMDGELAETTAGPARDHLRLLVGELRILEEKLDG